MNWLYPETSKASPLQRYTQDVSVKSTGLYTLTIFVFDIRGKINVILYILVSTGQLTVSLRISYS